MIKRNIQRQLLAAMKDTPAIFLAGARQTGKTTLMREVGGATGATLVTLDDFGMLSAAKADPQGFLAGLPERVAIDEVQRAPDLLVAIKQAIDINRSPGRFLLTGSANVLTGPQVSESLAGRMEILTLRPFSQGEILGRRETFIDAIFSGNLPTATSWNAGKSDLCGMVSTGGYPEVRERASNERRDAWFRNYVATIVQRDISDLAHIEGFSQIPDLLRLVAIRCAGQFNASDFSRTLQIPQTSLKRYLALLEQTYLAYRIEPWHVNLSLRIAKAPKVYMEDTGLACHLIGATAERLRSDRTLFGQILENFVINELRKQIEWSTTRPRIFHFRTHDGREVDCILEDPAGRCLGLEIKASGQVSADDARGLRFLKQQTGTRFHRGIILYNGTAIIPFDENIHAIPMDALWLW